ncbi:hypothetical protein ANO14919_099780 [Xylariales sp. No.14919]|nr:hypothetical protein ANO14919_099780 [Xylariales sp. No.14919]
MDSPASRSPSPSDSPSQMVKYVERWNWATNATSDSTNDKREEPWKKVFGDNIECQFNNSPELITVEDKSVPCSFRTLANSVSA